jgi:hypothetical protein
MDFQDRVIQDCERFRTVGVDERKALNGEPRRTGNEKTDVRLS